jgi:hypothetical protein
METKDQINDSVKELRSRIAILEKVALILKDRLESVLWESVQPEVKCDTYSKIPKAPMSEEIDVLAERVRVGTSVLQDITNRLQI